MGKTLNTGRLTNAISTDSSNNVGLGTTTPNSKLQVNGTDLTSFTSASYAPLFLQGGAYTGSQVQAIDFGSSSYSKPLVRIGAKIGSAGSSLQFGTSNAYNTGITNTAMTINESGNVGIGTSSPADILTISKSTYPQIRLIETTASTSAIFGYDTPAQEWRIRTLQAYPLTFGTGDTERMRITSGGNVLVGTTTETGNATGGTLNAGAVIERVGTITSQRNDSANMFLSKASGFTEGILIYFYAQGVARGSISTNGVNTSFNTSSDYRLKEDLKEYNGLSIISKLKTYDFKWKDTDVRDFGVMAHELAEVLPNYVNGEKDAINDDGSVKVQGVDYSKLVPILVKAIQELKAENDTLKTRIENLENK